MNKPVQPYRAFDRNEGTTILLETTSLDINKVLAVPASQSYRIDDLTNSRQVLDWTAVTTPAAVNTITVTGAQNMLNGRSNKREQRQITVKTTDSLGNDDYSIAIYTLIRIFTSQDQLI